MFQIMRLEGVLDRHDLWFVLSDISFLTNQEVVSSVSNVMKLLRRYWNLFSQLFEQVRELSDWNISRLLHFSFDFYIKFPDPIVFDDLDVGWRKMKLLHYIWRRAHQRYRRQISFPSCRYRSPCTNTTIAIFDLTGTHEVAGVLKGKYFGQ